MCIVKMIPVIGLLLVVTACASVREHQVWEGNSKDYLKSHEVAEVKKMPPNLKTTNLRPYYPIPPVVKKQADKTPPSLSPPGLAQASQKAATTKT